MKLSSVTVEPLQVLDLSVSYDVVDVLKNVSLHMNSDEIVAVIGGNGAGKSTMLKAVCGLLDMEGGRITCGEILSGGKSILGLKTEQLALNSIAFIPQGRRVFSSLSVLENIEMGAFTRKSSASVRTDVENVLKLLPQLKDKIKLPAGILSGGEQQMVAIARALMLKPKILLADEPSLGLSPNYVELIFEKFVQINRAGTSCLIVEQNATAVLDVCHRGYVFEMGKIALTGTRNELLIDERVRANYLGFA